MPKLSQIILKLFAFDFHRKIGAQGKIVFNCIIFDFRTLFHQGTDDPDCMKLVMDMILIHFQVQDKIFDVSHIFVTCKTSKL